MKRLIVISLFLVVCSGCSSIHSPYDRYDWCVRMGSTRLASIGPQAQDPAICKQQLEEDLANPTPSIVYVPKDIIMSPFIAARAAWVLLGMTKPPF